MPKVSKAQKAVASKVTPGKAYPADEALKIREVRRVDRRRDQSWHRRIEVGSSRPGFDGAAER
jgi:hypothetical protein